MNCPSFEAFFMKRVPTPPARLRRMARKSSRLFWMRLLRLRLLAPPALQLARPIRPRTPMSYNPRCILRGDIIQITVNPIDIHASLALNRLHSLANGRGPVIDRRYNRNFHKISFRRKRKLEAVISRLLFRYGAQKLMDAATPTLTPLGMSARSRSNS